MCNTLIIHLNVFLGQVDVHLYANVIFTDWGVRAKSDILPGQLIAEYKGKLCKEEPNDTEYIYEFQFCEGRKIKKMW